MAEPDTASLLASLTLDEKCRLIAGESQWRTARLNDWVFDDPSGARGEIFGENVPAAFLPSGVSLGATWDQDLLYEVAQLLVVRYQPDLCPIKLNSYHSDFDVVVSGGGGCQHHFKSKVCQCPGMSRQAVWTLNDEINHYC
ncbi:hypothetical protein BJX65DRAFT_314925 [Aspergillus insuetus]